MGKYIDADAEEIGRLNTELTQLRAEHKKLSEKHNAVVENYDYCISDNDALNHQIIQLHAENECLTKRLERAKEDAEAREAENEELKQKLETHKHDTEEYLKDFAAKLRERNAELITANHRV